MRYAKELKAFNEAANVGLDTYLAAVTALDLAETVGLDAVNERMSNLSFAAMGAAMKRTCLIMSLTH